MRRSDAGFTLLEVMASVAVLAIVFTTLARVANQGLQSQGISKRRLEASLLADAVLADIEVQIAEGTAPEIGRTESEEGRYAVVADVSAFDLAGAIPVPAEAPGTELGLGVPTQPAAGASSIGSAVRAIEIAVTWTEGMHEYRVIRSSYGFDLASVQELLDARAEGAPPPGAGDLAR